MRIPPKLAIAFAFVATFAAGAASMHLASSLVPTVLGSTPPGTWEETARALDLTPAQRRGIDSVFGRYQHSTDAVLESLMPRLAALSDSMHTEIEALLTPEQRTRLGEVQRQPTFLLRRKGPTGTRVDTLRVPRGP
jgi:Spy/CpxP family protein refolding chaperone